jgi:SAM-dependent methyltransferase
MRDVVTSFYEGTLAKLIRSGEISRTDNVLVVCGGQLDRNVMAHVGFPDFTITNLDGDNPQNAEKLTYDDGSFDVVVVHAGLHHCYSPHRALLEMYRVARKAVIAFESRDSFLMRTAIRFGLTLEYETDSILADGKGGVAGTGIPNFIYR